MVRVCDPFWLTARKLIVAQSTALQKKAPHVSKMPVYVDILCKHVLDTKQYSVEIRSGSVSVFCFSSSLTTWAQTHRQHKQQHCTGGLRHGCRPYLQPPLPVWRLSTSGCFTFLFFFSKLHSKYWLYFWVNPQKQQTYFPWALFLQRVKLEKSFLRRK